MILIAYDISNTKTRTQLSKYLLRYGRRLQFSIFEIDQPVSVHQKIIAHIRSTYGIRIKGNDSILIIPINASQRCSIVRMGSTIKELPKAACIIF